jgi:ABC-2 type transport system permease protein
MAFHPRRALAVFWKDFLDLRRNPALLASMAVLPLVFVMVPVAVVYAYVHEGSEGTLLAVAHFYAPQLPAGQSAARFLVDRTLVDWFGLFLVMPVFIPILISSQSVAGERERRTLEPLLASPLSAAELVAGKSLASLVPAVALTWLAFALLCVGVDWAAWPLEQAPLLPNGLWSYGILLLGPLFAFFGNAVAVLISAYVSEARTAQQVSALVVLPLLGLAAGQVSGLLHAGIAFYALEGLVVLVLDVLLVMVSLRVLDRERLLSRWG